MIIQAPGNGMITYTFDINDPNDSIIESENKEDGKTIRKGGGGHSRGAGGRRGR